MESATAVGGLLGPGAAQAVRSILVENMPKDMRSAQQLFEYFEKQFGEGLTWADDTDGCCFFYVFLKARGQWFILFFHPRLAQKPKQLRLPREEALPGKL